MSPPSSRKRVFISYKRSVEPDEQLALQVYRALQDAHEVFIDHQIPVGTHWGDEIQRQLRNSDFLVLLLSDHSAGSEMVRGEVQIAHDYAEVTDRPRILPVRVRLRTALPYPLSAYLNEINAIRWEMAEDTPHVLEALSRVIAGDPPDPVARAGTNEKAPAVIQPPLFAAQPPYLEQPEGTMDLESRYYVTRQTDHAALAAIRLSDIGITMTIKGPRQMGKSSLLMRVIREGRNGGKRDVFVDFQLFGTATLAESSRFFRQFATTLSRGLDVENRVADYWQPDLADPQRCTEYLEEHILSNVPGPVLIAMDEVDSVFGAPFRDDFFGMLRSWHNLRPLSSSLRRLDLTLVTSTEPYLFIQNLYQSPFNVGNTVTLSDFTLAEVHDLNMRHNEPLDADEERGLTGVVGGHPYLVRRALYLATRGDMTPREIIQRAADTQGPFADHLGYHLLRLQQSPDLATAFRHVLRAHECRNSLDYYRLQGAGLVTRSANDAVVPRCPAYAEFFQRHLRHG
jgi:hypothetical protein